MKKRLHSFDVFCFFTSLALLFTVGYHLGLGKEENEPLEVTVTLRLEKSKSSDSLSGALIDGKYYCEIISLDNSMLSFKCLGEYREAGFLTSGAKYLSKNQPIEIIGNGNYFFGRITEIRRTG